MTNELLKTGLPLVDTAEVKVISYQTKLKPFSAKTECYGISIDGRVDCLDCATHNGAQKIMGRIQKSRIKKIRTALRKLKQLGMGDAECDFEFDAGNLTVWRGTPKYRFYGVRFG